MDDHSLFHESLSAVLYNAFAGVEVHCEAVLAGALSRARGCGELDLVLLDPGLPDSAPCFSGCACSSLRAQARPALNQPRSASPVRTGSPLRFDAVPASTGTNMIVAGRREICRLTSMKLYCM